MVEGIGQEVVPENVHIKYVDEVVNVTDRESFELSRQLGRQEGIFCGGSTGTNLGAALKVARSLDETGVVVFIVCDTGERYLSKHHSDEWMREKRLLEPQRITASILVGTKVASHPHGVVSADPAATVATVLGMMQETQLSLIPVLDDGEPVGSVRETRMLARLLENRDLLESPISEIMDPSFPIVDDEAGFAEIVGLLQKGPAILVREYGRITGILTRHDLLDVPQGN